MKLLVVVEQTETGFSAYLPDVPGCVAIGTSSTRIGIVSTTMNLPSELRHWSNRMPLHPRITHVTVRERFELLLHFTDGSSGVVDLAPWIAGRRGVFAALQDERVFRSVTVDRDAGTLAWPNGADLDPDLLFEAAHLA